MPTIELSPELIDALAHWPADLDALAFEIAHLTRQSQLFWALGVRELKTAAVQTQAQATKKETP